MSTVSPFLERTLKEQHLPYHLVKNIKNAQMGKKTNIRVDLNELYGWDTSIPHHSYCLLRSIIMKKNCVGPILEHDIKYNQTRHLLEMAQKEYEYQKKQVKQGKRKHIQVDYNLMYC